MPAGDDPDPRSGSWYLVVLPEHPRETNSWPWRYIPNCISFLLRSQPLPPSPCTGVEITLTLRSKKKQNWWRGFYAMGAHPGAFSRRKRMPPRWDDKMTIFIKIAPIAILLCLAIFRWIKWWFSSKSAPQEIGHAWAISSFDKMEVFKKCNH